MHRISPSSRSRLSSVLGRSVILETLEAAGCWLFIIDQDPFSDGSQQVAEFLLFCGCQGLETAGDGAKVGGGMLADEITAVRGEANVKAPPVVRIEPPFDQAFVFQVADEGADGVAADALAGADFRGIELRTAVQFFTF